MLLPRLDEFNLQPVISKESVMCLTSKNVHWKVHLPHQVPFSTRLQGHKHNYRQDMSVVCRFLLVLPFLTHSDICISKILVFSMDDNNKNNR